MILLGLDFENCVNIFKYDYYYYFNIKKNTYLFIYLSQIMGI
jgi:hypothetical protein